MGSDAGRDLDQPSSIRKSPVTCHREAVTAPMVLRPQHAVLSPDGKSRGNVTLLGAASDGTAVTFTGVT